MTHVDDIKSSLRYEPSSGEFFWLKRTGGPSANGKKVTGTFDDRGYIRIGVAGEIHRAHRLAWLLTHGDWPAGEIDHINCNKADNRMANLRDVDRTSNQQNQRSANKNSSSGLRGVYPHANGLWRARITVEGKSKSLGLHPNPEQAHKAYLDAKRNFHKGCTQ